MNNRKHSSEDLYRRYDRTSNAKLKDSYLRLLKGRAAIGNTDAQKYVDKINLVK